MKLAATWRSCWRPKDRRPIWEWASRGTITLPPCLTRPGEFCVTESRHFIAPFDALQNEHVREVNIMAPVRSGKTLIADVWVPWTRANEPGPTRYVCQTGKPAKDQAELRTIPMLKSCAEIRSMLPADRHQTRTQEIIFSDGLPLYIDGPSVQTMQNKGFRYIVCDEPWLYDDGQDTGGDLSEIDGRVGDFLKLENSKILRVSQGGRETGGWQQRFDAGELNEWHVQCAGCGQYFTPVWSVVRPDGKRFGMMWDEFKNERGDWVIEKSLPTVRFECPLCGHPHFDSPRTKSEWNRTGKYLVIGESNARRKSFHWNAIIDFPWIELVDLWLQARNAFHQGMIEPTIAFWQKRMALPKSEGGVHDAEQRLKIVTYDVKSDWPEEVARYMTIDRQEEDLYWWTVRAWSHERSRRLAWGKAYSAAALEETRIEWKVDTNHVGIDSGYRSKGDNGVYDFCVRFGWVALKGADDPYFWHQYRRKGGASRRVQKCYAPLTYGDPASGRSGEGSGPMARLIRFSSCTCADLLQGLIDKTIWEEPVSAEDDRMEAEYRRQMSSEYKKKRISKVTGREEWVWFQARKDNHAWDLAKMQVLFAVLGDLLPDPFAIAEEKEKPA